MSKIPLPELGQPLDVEYMYRIASAINSLAEHVSSATSKYTTVHSLDSGKQNVKTGDARIVAGYAVVNAPASISANTSIAFTFSLGEGFKYAPVVTATPINRGATSSLADVSVMISSVTTQSVTGQIYYRTAGSFDMNVNIIAVGIPV